MTIKMIPERIMKMLLKSKIICNFKLIYSHIRVWDTQFEYVFTDDT